MITLRQQYFQKRTYTFTILGNKDFFELIHNDYEIKHEVQ